MQLQSALEELNSVNLIKSLLQEEINTLSQTPYGISKDNNAWSTTKTNSTTATRPLKTTHTSAGPIKTSQFPTQTTNRFAALSSLKEPHQQNYSMLSSNFVHS